MAADPSDCEHEHATDVRGDPADELIAAMSVVHKVPLLTRDRALLGSELVPLAS